MAFKPVGQPKEIGEQIIKWDAEGKVVEGKLLSAEIDVKTSQGINNVYRLENEDGQILTMFGSSQLNRKLQACQLGDWVIITQMGTRPGSKPGRTLKLFKVERIPGEGVFDPGDEEADEHVAAG